MHISRLDRGTDSNDRLGIEIGTDGEPRIRRQVHWSTRLIQLGMILTLIPLLTMEGVAQLATVAMTGKNEPPAAPRVAPRPAKTDEMEMVRLIGLLEARIQQLEDRLASMGVEREEVKPAGIAEARISLQEGAPPPALTIQQTEKIEKEVAELKEEAKQNGQFLKFLKDVQVTGVVDGYYSYNSNQVDMFSQGRAFDVRHNSFSLQLARLGLTKEASLDSPLGFQFDIGLGETVDRIISVSDAQQNESTKHILQAYVSYVAPIGKGLTIDFGKMYTPVGAEVIDTANNFNYSRGWLFAFGPYYHMGLRAKYELTDKVAVSGFLFDGWDNIFENNRARSAGKTTGFQLSLNPTNRLSLTQTYLGGPEAPLANVPDISSRDNWRHVADTVATYLVTDKLSLMGNFVTGSDGDDGGNRGSWTGASGYLRYAFNDRFAFSPRFEVFHDGEGLRTGTAQTVKGLTLTQEMKLASQLVTRFEFRRDLSNRDFFSNAAGNSLRHQNTFIVGLSYSFSSRE
jgi:hypothetical protein